MAGWTYLLLSERGEVYLGATTNLRSRLRSHNSTDNTGWTRGRRWHLLAVREFSSMGTALHHERTLKKRPHQKIKWKLRMIPRAVKIRQRFSYTFKPEEWPTLHSRKRKTSRSESILKFSSS